MHKLTFNANTTPLLDFFEDFSESAERAVGPHAQQLTASLMYPKITSDLKNALNLAQLETETYDQIVARPELELYFSRTKKNVKLHVAMMATTTTSHENQTKNTEKSGKAADTVKKQVLLSKNAKKAIAKSRNDKMKNKTSKEPLPKTYSLRPHCHRNNHPSEFL